MKRHRAYVATVAVVVGLTAAAGFLAAGCEMCCNSSRGSGSILYTDPATNNTGKATFSYRVQCEGSYAEDGSRVVTGRLEYQDHKPWKKNGTPKAEVVRIHGSVGDVAAIESATEIPFYGPAGSETFCSQNLNFAAFTGTYKPQPVTLGEGGTFTVAVWDNGKPGPSPEDTFTLELTGGVFDGYKVSGTLAGGNIEAL